MAFTFCTHTVSSTEPYTGVQQHKSRHRNGRIYGWTVAVVRRGHDRCVQPRGRAGNERDCVCARLLASFLPCPCMVGCNSSSICRMFRRARWVHELRSGHPCSSGCILVHNPAWQQRMNVGIVYAWWYIATFTQSQEKCLCYGADACVGDEASLVM